MSETIKEEDQEDSSESPQLDFGQVVDLVLTRPSSEFKPGDANVDTALDEDDNADEDDDDLAEDTHLFLDTKSIR